MPRFGVSLPATPNHTTEAGERRRHEKRHRRPRGARTADVAVAVVRAGPGALLIPRTGARLPPGVRVRGQIETAHFGVDTAIAAPGAGILVGIRSRVVAGRVSRLSVAVIEGTLRGVLHHATDLTGRAYRVGTRIRRAGPALAALAVGAVHAGARIGHAAPGVTGLAVRADDAAARVGHALAVETQFVQRTGPPCTALDTRAGPAEEALGAGDRATEPAIG